MLQDAATEAGKYQRQVSREAAASTLWLRDKVLHRSAPLPAWVARA